MRSFFLKRVVLTALWLSLALSGLFDFPAFADNRPEFQNDLQTWQLVTIQGNVTKRIIAYFDTQNNVVSLTDNSKTYNGRTHEGILFVRPALGYQLNKYVSLWQGVGWTPSFQPRFRNEKQLWEQVLIEKDFKHFRLSNRTRLEIRDIDNTSGTACRLREKLLVKVPFGKTKKWSVVAYNEAFINLNTVGNGPRGGFDQNWLFVGINRQFNKHVNAELGYLNNYVNVPTPGIDRMNHAIMAGLSLRVN